MKIFLIVLLFLLSTSAVAHKSMMLPIVRIIDGDTIETTFGWRMPAPLNKVKIRLYGIDTPESPAKSYKKTGKLGRAKCVKEAELALKAKARVVEITRGHRKMFISNYFWGKFGGRIIAKVSVHGIDISKTLINEGFAVEYFGSGPKKDWCQ